MSHDGHLETNTFIQRFDILVCCFLPHLSYAPSLEFENTAINFFYILREGLGNYFRKLF